MSSKVLKGIKKKVEVEAEVEAEAEERHGCGRPGEG